MAVADPLSSGSFLKVETRDVEEWEQQFTDALEIGYSYELAKRMEQFKTNPALGYRTAGSKAEFETGEMLCREMEAIGLADVRKDRVTVDAWEFEKAEMRFTDAAGTEHCFQLGAYQTNFDTRGPREFQMVYLGKGTADCYERVDVKGKLVLVDINQRDEWWINFPVYQAWLRGAAALVAVQEQGYGEIHNTALNAQDIAGPADAPAFSISQADAWVLKKAMMEAGSCPDESEMEPGNMGGIAVRFEARTTVVPDRETYNITGTIPGRNTDRMILLSAHYDSYFSGFQDDNAAVAMMLGIARAFLKCGYKPKYNLVFCAMAAEEWGVANSKYDWSTGAYEQVFTARPEWRGRTFADLNFELPAHAHGRRDAVRCTYEYEDFLSRFLEGIEVDREAYPEGVEVLCPIQTWSDDFSMAVAGIPSMVNEFSGGEFMETHYHSQFDNDNVYQEPVYRFHHMLYGRLVMAFDRLVLPPMNFERLIRAVADSDDVGVRRRAEADFWGMKYALRGAREVSRALYRRIRQINQEYGALLAAGDVEEADRMFARCGALQERLLYIFRKEQDYFVRLNWHDEVLFPQEAVQDNLRALYKALRHVEEGNARAALEDIYGIDNNRYAFLFDEQTFGYFTQYVLNQPDSRLKWGAGRIVHHENLFHLVQSLKKKLAAERESGAAAAETAAAALSPQAPASRPPEAALPVDLTPEYQELRRVTDNQIACYRDDIRYMTESIKKLTAWMQECLTM